MLIVGRDDEVKALRQSAETASFVVLWKWVLIRVDGHAPVGHLPLIASRKIVKLIEDFVVMRSMESRAGRGIDCKVLIIGNNIRCWGNFPIASLYGRGRSSLMLRRKTMAEMEC